MRHQMLTSCIFAFFVLLSSLCYGLTIDASNYNLNPNDATPAILKALEDCQTQNAAKLIIPKGIYHFHPDKAFEKYVRISGNDDGLKRIAFPIHGFEQFEIDGQGSQFIMHGEMVTFDIQKSILITLRNFSIDWNKPFFFQGHVIAVDKETNSFDIEVFDECDYQIVANELIFLEKPGKAIKSWSNWAKTLKKDIGWEQNIDWNIWYDPETKASPYKGGAYTLRSFNEQLQKRYHVKEIEKGVLRLYDAAPRLPKKDWVIIIKGNKDVNRTSPAIHLWNVKDFLIENVNIHHAGGMGLIAERSENITMEKLHFILPPNSDRMVTTTADATHFNNCKGLVSFNNCFFENMLDDAANVHGMYTQVVGLVDDHTIDVNRMHRLHLGFQFATAGDSIRLFNKFTLKPYAGFEVKSTKNYNGEYMEITLTEKVNDILRPESVADNLTWQADMVMKNCTVRRNRARTLLFSTGGDVLIENNNFFTCTSRSILIDGDATRWYKSGPVHNAIIRNNRFKDIGLFVGNAPLIQFTPRVSFENEPTHYYNHNVLFENNSCEVFGRILVRARSVENFVFRGNTITQSQTYPAVSSDGDAFIFEQCKDIVIEENKYLFDEEATIKVDEWTRNVTVKNNNGIKKIE